MSVRPSLKEKRLACLARSPPLCSLRRTFLAERCRSCTAPSPSQSLHLKEIAGLPHRMPHVPP